MTDKWKRFNNSKKLYTAHTHIYYMYMYMRVLKLDQI